MKVVVSAVNFIPSHGLYHHHFNLFLLEIDAEYGDVLYYTEVQG
jgi:hypothetical protein